MLIRLDGATIQSDLVIMDARIFEITARRARLVAERGGATRITFASDLTSGASQTAARRAVLAGQTRLLDARRLARGQESRARAEESAQIAFQVRGIDAQIDALATQQRLGMQRLGDQNQLLARGLTTAATVLALEQDIAVIRGKIGVAVAQRASTQARISGLKIAVLRTLSQHREQVISQLRDLEFRLNELTEQRLALNGRLSDLDIRAPIDGTGWALVRLRKILW